MKNKIVFNFIYCCRAYIFTYNTKYQKYTVVHPGFSRGGASLLFDHLPPPKKNLHENEEILGQRGGDAFFVLPRSINDI